MKVIKILWLFYAGFLHTKVRMKDLMIGLI